jgi:ADP-heptose:LPS heptosyltransferase
VTTREIRIRVSAEELATARRLITTPEDPLPWPLVSVHPGASWRAEYRMWPLDRYVALIRRLRGQLQATVLILGSQAERPLGDRLMARLHDPAVCCAVGRTSIGEMAALIRLSQVFIGNDSGPLHIALALGTPSVGIFATTLPEQVLSAPGKCVAIRGAAPGVRYYTHQHDFAYTGEHLAALGRISVDAVMQAVQEALGSPSAPPPSGVVPDPRTLFAAPPGAR